MSIFKSTAKHRHKHEWSAWSEVLGVLDPYQDRRCVLPKCGIAERRFL